MSYLKKLSIEHFKGFYEEQILEFGIPDQQKEGSGLTVITGPNNTGKTSVIEALLIGERNKKLFDEDCHLNCKPIIKFLQSDDKEVTFTNINNGSLIQRTGEQTTSIAVVFSRRFRNSEFNGEWSEKTYFDQTLQKSNIRDNNIHELIPMLKILENSGRRNQFDRLLKSVLPNINNRTIGSNKHGDYVKYTSGGGDIHTSASLGDGVLSVFVICAALSSGLFDRHMIIIDEPELSLHPQAQKRLAKVLSEESKGRQVIICTHSPYFINRKDFINGAKFVRLNKINDKKCTIHCLGPSSSYSITEGAIYDWHKPYTLEDIAAKEIMFSEKILFVEGQDDVGLIKKYCDGNFELNFDIFGYGAGGWGRFRAFLKMAKDLGLKKVGVLYDGDVPEDEVNDVKSNFTEEGYKIKQLSTDDIRDKEPVYNSDGSERLPQKIGIFDSRGNIKSDKQHEFDSILNEFIEYFS